MKNFKQVQITSRAELRQWLQHNHHQQESIWLVRYKKASGKPVVPYDDVVEEAICFGWIDSAVAKLDEERAMLLLSPRKSGSSWSKVNKARVERLVSQKLMTEIGIAKIREAQADGSWDFLNDVDELIVPEDLQIALDRLPKAASNFAAFTPPLGGEFLSGLRTQNSQQPGKNESVKQRAWRQLM